MIRRKIMQKLVDLVLPGHSLVSPPYEQIVVENTKGIVRSGSGPEVALARFHDNPNWHWNRAANEVAVAKWLEKHG